MRKCGKLPPHGNHFDPSRVPHVLAPGGPIDALEREQYREVVLMWATRMFKTATSHLYLLWRADQDPVPMLMATSTKLVAEQQVRTKLEVMLEHTPRLKQQLRSPHKRKLTRIDLRHCRIFIGWSGSESTLADLSAKVVLINEVDKWDSSSSDEADPVELARQRAKEYWDRKVILDGTPNVAGTSRLEKAFAGSTRHRFFVGCPHCQMRQVLRFGGRDAMKNGGVVWDRTPDGKHDAQLAARTARYVCAGCKGEIRDEHRTKMIRGGVWAPEGAHVAADGAVTAAPDDNEVYGCHISSLYYLDLTWGYFARKFVLVRHDPTKLQDFFNSDLGEPFERTPPATDPVELRSRCVLEYPRALAPAQCLFVTAGVDRQIDHWRWLMCGWGGGALGRLIDWGICYSDEELDARVIKARVPRIGDSAALPVARSFVDSSAFTSRVYTFCDERLVDGWPVVPIKGSSGWMATAWRFGNRDEKEYPVAKGMSPPLVLVNTNYWQEVANDVFATRRPDDRGGFGFPREAAEDDDLWAQLLSETRVLEIDATGHEKWIWKRRDLAVQNHYRDCWRYARAAAEMMTYGAWDSVIPITELAVVAGQTPGGSAAESTELGERRRRPPRRRRERPRRRR